MKKLNRKTANINQIYPERILQFGGGNFLRGFVDWIIERYNRQSNDEKLGIVVIKVRKEGSYQDWKDQDGLFHMFIKGYANGKIIDEKTLIKSVGRIIHAHGDWIEFINSAQQPLLNIIISNTTETGINFDENDNIDQTPSTFPGQLCQWLYHRFTYFNGVRKAGCIIIPCELINNNGELLKQVLLQYAIHWNYGDAFIKWLENENHFCNTLVDRIVSGIKEENIQKYQERVGYEDQLMTESEPYHLWAIESKYDIGSRLSLNRIGLNVIYTTNLKPYRELKLKILNGAHSSMVPIGLLLKLEKVIDVMNHENLSTFIEKLILEEVLPSLDVDKESGKEFANEVIDRFKNPFLDHYLKSISLYSISKFNNRYKPTIKAYLSLNNKLPERLMLAFSSMLIYYRGNLNDLHFNPSDQKEKINCLQNHWSKISKSKIYDSSMLQDLLAEKSLWEEDLNDIKGFSALVADNLNLINSGKLMEKIINLS